MRFGRLAAVCAGAALLCGAPAPAAPLRVMSINECGDQLVLALLPPAQIASVTWLSRDPSGSVMARAAGRVPVNHGAAEDVVRDHPDLIVAGAYTTPAVRLLLKALHFRVLELTSPRNFDEIRRQTRTVAAAVGEQGRGEALIARMDAALIHLARTPGPNVRVAAWDEAGLSATPGSMYDALLRAAGARNVADERRTAWSGGHDVEALLAAAPDLIVRGEPAFQRPGLGADVVGHPLVRRFWSDRTVILAQSAYVCATPFSVDAAVRLRQALMAASRRGAPALPFSPKAWR